MRKPGRKALNTLINAESDQVKSKAEPTKRPRLSQQQNAQVESERVTILIEMKQRAGLGPVAPELLSKAEAAVAASVSPAVLEPMKQTMEQELGAEDILDSLDEKSLNKPGQKKTCNCKQGGCRQRYCVCLK